MSASKGGSGPIDVSSHANVVTITDNSNSLSGITYVDNSLQITSGQPSSPPATIGVQNNVFTITMNCGRENSSSVADAFNSATGGSANEYAPEGGGGASPNELNFFFAVTLEFQTAAGSAYVEVYLGQGSWGVTNNWWIGGSCISSAGTPVLAYTAGGQVTTLSLSGTNDTFTFTLANVRPATPITNVFVLMLENHSFDNLFAFSGIPGIYAATTSNCNTYNGTSYCVQSGAPLSMPTDPGHEFPDVVEQLAGAGESYPWGGPYPAINNSGFASNYATTTTEGPPPPSADIGDIMACFDTSTQTPVIYELATQFALCDQWFSSLPGPTWPNRFFVHGASSAGLDHSPTTEEILLWEGSAAFGGGFSYPKGSIYDTMNAGNISWGLYIDTSGNYFGAIPQVGSVHGIGSEDVGSLSGFVSALQQGNYPYQYTFIEPNYGDVTSGTYEGGSSQHPMDSVSGGEQLIKTVYEAIRSSSVWNSSLLIITYDEHGGFYDYYPPGTADAPNDNSPDTNNEYGFNFVQLGVRVPAVIVSPWIAAGFVDHGTYDHASVLATVEYLFGLSPLTQRDTNANNLVHLISSTLRTDCPTTLPDPVSIAPKAPLTAEEQVNRDIQPLPQTGNLPGFLGVMLKTDLELSSGDPVERAAIIERFKNIKTRGDARAYIISVKTKAALAKVQSRK